MKGLVWMIVGSRTGPDASTAAAASLVAGLVVTGGAMDAVPGSVGTMTAVLLLW